ncbi:MAG: Mrp/NBP35 family ATP-binding protein [Gammaproteobacteria bacterium]|nr:Mrp/NBP35 family ATP-binding protein [Gammaproteobacteria bacterium]
MPDLDTAAIERAVAAVAVPEFGTDLAGAGALIRLEKGGARPAVNVRLALPLARIRAGLETSIAAAAAEAAGCPVDVGVEAVIAAHKPQGTLAPLPAVRNMIAIASGKGGVGKSTTAVNLALALHREGARVGLLDADVYGPSQPLMLGLLGRQPESLDGKTFEPLTAYGIETISVGFLVKEEAPVIWRGPMVTQAVSQLTFQTNWHDLDFLLVDLPPGTGDTQLTLSQKVPLAGVVIVTTPQEIAAQVARRGLRMFEKMGVSVLGVIENMASFVCPSCAHEAPLFGAGGGERLAAECGVPLLGAVPLVASIRAQTDAGCPPVVAEPDGVVAARYASIARQLALALARRPRDQKHLFPRIVVEDRA